jgi:hypothetical protein
MPIQSKVDFIVIGAQKAGTTSLFHYLRAHQQIHIPFAKEVGFFSRERLFNKGAPWYLNQFADATPQQIVGEASPQYMMNPAVPARIHALFPGIKLIAILRNPIDRAYSSYRMTVRLGSEKRSVQAALLSPPLPNLDQPFTAFDYLGMGLYGKILEGYLKYFPIEQIRLVFTEELAMQPEKVLHDLYGFIGVDAGFTPHNIHHVYHRGGQQKYLGLRPLKRFLSILEKSIPSRYRGWTFLFDQWNTKPNQGSDLPIELRDQLANYYSADVAHLQSLFRVQVPWLEFPRPDKKS